MPLIKNSSYPTPPIYYRNGHLQSILPSLFRKVKDIEYKRERFIFKDGDFVDLDWLENSNKNLIILTHGLEGDSNRQYIKGAAKYFHQRNWDVLAWNCRSCSGEMNKALRMYNHGEIEDIGAIIENVLQQKDYDKIVLLGFSMGGNINMKYCGVHGKSLSEKIKACIAFSSPADLMDSAAILDRTSNWLYKTRFQKYLIRKIKIKAEQYPGVVDINNFKKIKVWKDFDEYFSAPLNGFNSADEFYWQASAKNYMEGTNIPILLVNAQNDPILTPSCSPIDLCESHPLLFLERPEFGGHVGFGMIGEEISWMEKRAEEFIDNL